MRLTGRWCLDYCVFWMADVGGKHNLGKFSFSWPYFKKDDSSWEDNSKLQIELLLLTLLSFDFMAYYVAQKCWIAL